MNFMDVYRYTYVNIDRPQCITHVPGKTIATIDAYLYIYMTVPVQANDRRTNPSIIFYAYTYVYTIVKMHRLGNPGDLSHIYIHMRARNQLTGALAHQ